MYTPEKHLPTPPLSLQGFARLSLDRQQCVLSGLRDTCELLVSHALLRPSALLNAPTQDTGGGAAPANTGGGGGAHNTGGCSACNTGGGAAALANTGGSFCSSISSPTGTFGARPTVGEDSDESHDYVFVSQVCMRMYTHICIYVYIYLFINMPLTGGGEDSGEAHD